MPRAEILLKLVLNTNQSINQKVYHFLLGNICLIKENAKFVLTVFTKLEILIYFFRCMVIYSEQAV